MSKGEGTPFYLTCVTLGYDEFHDRIYIDGRTAEESRIRLWITQRLIRRLAAYLVETENETSADDRPVKNESLVGGESAKLSTPVAFMHGDPNLLVRSVDVTRRQSDILLLRKSDVVGQSALFALPKIAIKKWLDGLSRCFKKAEWPPISDFPNAQPDNQESFVTIH